MFASQCNVLLLRFVWADFEMMHVLLLFEHILVSHSTRHWLWQCSTSQHIACPCHRVSEMINMTFRNDPKSTYRHVLKLLSVSLRYVQLSIMTASSFQQLQQTPQLMCMSKRKCFEISVVWAHRAANLEWFVRKSTGESFNLEKKFQQDANDNKVLVVVSFCLERFKWE